METTVTEAGRFERLLTLTLDESELEDAKNAAARKLAKEIKVKGFRPGKAPRAVIERTVGSEALRSEAIDDSLGRFVTDALGETDLEPVTTPRVEAINDGDEGGVTVEVRITLWPTLDELPDYAGRRIVVEAPLVEESEVEEQIDRFRAQFAELEDVDREADDGDFVMIDLSTALDGDAIEEASAEDLLYGIGSGAFMPGLDELLIGVKPGDIRQGPSRLPEGFGDHGGEDVVIKVLVKGVRGKKLPEVTDEWVSDVSEFESIDELNEQLRTNMHIMKLSAATTAFQESLIEQLVDETELELPEPLVEAEMEARVHNMAHALEEQGIDFANYLQITGQDQDAFTADVRAHATRNLKTQLLFDAVAERESIEVGDEDIDAAVAEVAASSDREPEAVRATLEASGQVASLTGDILRRKALERLLEAAVPVDGEGNEVDLTPPVVDDRPPEAGVEAPPEAGVEAEKMAMNEDDIAVVAADEPSAESADVKDSADDADNDTE